jgi:hypothetical protein
VDEEIDRMRKEVVSTYFKVISQHLAGGIGIKHK